MDIIIPSMIDPGDGAAGQARHVDLRAVRAVPRERRLERREARSVRRRGRSTRSPSTRRTSSPRSCTGRCSRRRTSSASRAHRRQHLPGRAGARSSCSSCVPRRAGRSTARRSTGSASAARARTRAAASWAPRGRNAAHARYWGGRVKRYDVSSSARAPTASWRRTDLARARHACSVVGSRPSADHALASRLGSAAIVTRARSRAHGLQIDKPDPWVTRRFRTAAASSSRATSRARSRRSAG